jgi:ketosteroid isomerase-like protein
VAQENLPIVLRTFAAYVRGDESPLFEVASPEIVVTQFPDQPDVQDFRGHDGLREVMDTWVGSWDDWTIEPLSASEDEGLVFVTARQRGRGKGSGVPMENVVTFVFTLRDGLVVRWQMFHDDEEARAAVGLG